MGVKETAERRVGQEVLHVARDQSEASSASEISKWYEHHVHTQGGMPPRCTSVLLGDVRERSEEEGRTKATQRE